MNKKFLYLLTSFLLVLSFLSLAWEILPNRYLRIVTALSFACLVFRKVPPTKPMIVLCLSLPLLILSDISFLTWELKISKIFYYSFHLLATACIIAGTVGKIKKIKFSYVDSIFLGIIFSVLCWILFTLGTYFSSVIPDDLLNVLFYLNGAFIVFSVFTSFFFSANLVEKNSSFLFLGVLGLALSDLLLFAIYVMESAELRYVDNLFYIFGLSFLTRFIMEERQLEEEKRQAENQAEEIPVKETTEVYS